MKTTTSKPAQGKTAVKEAETKKPTTETKASTATVSKPIKEANVTIISEEKVSVTPVAEISHEAIAEMAYFLWAAEGYQHGLHDEYWLRAEFTLKQKK